MNNKINCFYIIFVSVLSFLGGSISFYFWRSLYDVRTGIDKADAISISNTYIVFTTFIFVGISLIFVLMGTILAQQFAQSKEEQTAHILKELGKKLKSDEKYGTEFVAQVFEKEEVKHYLQEKVKEKLKQQIDEMSENVSKEQKAVQKLKESLNSSK